MFTKKAQGVAKISSNVSDFIIYPSRIKALQGNAIFTLGSVQNPKAKISLKLTAKFFDFNGSR